MSQLEDIKARAEELGQTTTRDLASKIIEYGEGYTLLAKFEADHRRLIAALEAVEKLANDLIEENEDAMSLQAWGFTVAGRKVRQAIEEALR